MPKNTHKNTDVFFLHKVRISNFLEVSERSALITVNTMCVFDMSEDTHYETLKKLFKGRVEVKNTPDFITTIFVSKNTKASYMGKIYGRA